MRTTVAILLAIVMIFAGFTMLGMQSEQVEEPALNNTSNTTSEVYNMSNELYEGLGETFAPGIVWMGVAAILLVAAGYLAAIGRGGR